MKLDFFRTKKVSAKLAESLSNYLQERKQPISQKDIETFKIITLGKRDDYESNITAKLAYHPKNVETIMFDFDKEVHMSKYMKHNYERGHPKVFSNKPTIIEMNKKNNNKIFPIQVILNGIRFDTASNEKIEIVNAKLYTITFEKTLFEKTPTNYIEFFAKTKTSVKWVYLPFENEQTRNIFQQYMSTLNYTQLIK
jgi:hypothetical protein